MEFFPLLLSTLTSVLVGAALCGVWSRRRLQVELTAVKAPLETRTRHLEELLTTSQSEARDLSERESTLRAQVEDLKIEQARLQEQGRAIPRLEEALKTSEAEVRTTQETLAQRNTTLAEQEVALQNERTSAKEKLTLLEEARTELTAQFKVLAQNILEEKSERFTKQNKTQLNELLTPFKTQLGNFQKRVEDVYDKESKDRVSLHTEIVNLQKLNHQISSDAINLTNALKGDNKTQGNWGELVLERLLEASGLVKGREYDREVSIVNEDGTRRRPDVVVHLPEGKDVIVDSKVSLTAYEAFCAASDEALQEQHLKEHIQSLRTHIRGLSEKRYEDLPGLRTAGYVLMFVPVEPAFLVAMQRDPNLFLDAFNLNIMLVSPTTLLLTLRTIESIWRNEDQNQNAHKIAVEAGKLYDKFVGFADSLQTVSTKLTAAQESFDKARSQLSTGRGNLVNRAQGLKKLGVQSKKDLPDALLEAAMLNSDEPQLLPAAQD